MASIMQQSDSNEARLRKARLGLRITSTLDPIDRVAVRLPALEFFLNWA